MQWFGLVNCPLDGKVCSRCGALVGRPHSVKDAGGLRHAVEALSRAGKRISVHLVLCLEPAGAQANF